MSIHRGEIYFVDLNPIIGRETAGRRPVLVLSSDSVNRLPLVIIMVVGTDGANVPRDYPTNVRVSAAESGLSRETVFLCCQMRSLDARRFPENAAGKLSTEIMMKIEDTVRRCLEL